MNKSINYKQIFSHNILLKLISFKVLFGIDITKVTAVILNKAISNHINRFIKSFFAVADFKSSHLKTCNINFTP